MLTELHFHLQGPILNLNRPVTQSKTHTIFFIQNRFSHLGGIWIRTKCVRPETTVHIILLFLIFFFYNFLLIVGKLICTHTHTQTLACKLTSYRVRRTTCCSINSRLMRFNPLRGPVINRFDFGRMWCPRTKIGLTNWSRYVHACTLARGSSVF